MAAEVMEAEARSLQTQRDLQSRLKMLYASRICSFKVVHRSAGTGSRGSIKDWHRTACPTGGKSLVVYIWDERGKWQSCHWQ